MNEPVRADPIPKGIYWVDVSPAARPLWEAWSLLHREFGRIRVLTTETFAESPGAFWDSGPTRDWILFEVLEPVPRWPAVAETPLGLPNVGFREMTRADTVQRPPPPELPSLEDAFATSARTVGGVVAVGFLLYVGLKALKG